MAHLPTNEKTTLYQIDKKIEENVHSHFRPHLGGSQIGEECQRSLWYTFRWFSGQKFPARLLRLFHRGHREEEVFVSMLESVGVKTYGFQQRVEAHGGHFGGSLDGMAEGLIESPNKVHLLEFKTHNDKKFKELLKHGVQKGFPKYYAQMQVYMYLAKLKVAFYMGVNKNDDALYSERIKIDRKVGKELLEKAEMIIFDKNPPSKISNLASSWVCKWCGHRDTCHYGDKPEMNCRTCRHSNAIVDGTWWCALHSTALSLEKQREGCHEYTLPIFLVK